MSTTGPAVPTSPAALALDAHHIGGPTGALLAAIARAWGDHLDHPTGPTEAWRWSEPVIRAHTLATHLRQEVPS